MGFFVSEYGFYQIHKKEKRSRGNSTARKQTKIKNKLLIFLLPAVVVTLVNDGSGQLKVIAADLSLDQISIIVNSGVIAIVLIVLIIHFLVSRVIAPLGGITKNIADMTEGDFTIAV